MTRAMIRGFRGGAVLVAVLGAVLAGVPTTRAAPRAGTDLVRVDTGVLRGRVLADHRVFEGIPFAAPPVGRARWRAPGPAAPWRGVRDATAPGAVCPQAASDGSGRVVGSEDCLYLNVTTPVTDRQQTRLPVVVWLAGGGFVGGAGSQYDPTRLAVQGRVVVVTLNYRLGALGFLLDRSLMSADPAVAGNYGLADQQAGLRWVRRNIAAFGGDPGNVTLAGQSAGAYSVCAQLASPRARGLFERAIVQSGPCGNAFVTRDTALRRGARTAALLGCADAACLRAKPVAALVGLDSAQVFTSTGRLRDMPWTPVVGTPLLPRQPLDALSHGAAASIPLLQGTTHDEMRPFVALEHDARGRPLTAAEYPMILRQVFGADASAVAARYPADRFPSPGLALATALTDWGGKLGACPARAADDAAARHGSVHAYEFAQDDGARIAGFPLGAPHSAELPYLFDGTFGQPGPGPTSTPAGAALARQLVGYWSAFAHGASPWPAYRSGGPVLSLASGPGGIHPVDFATEHHCDFWSTLRRGGR